MLLPLLSGCSGAATVCPADLRYTLSPGDTTIAPGEQFTVKLTLLGCGGSRVLSDSLTFTSSNLDVLVVGKSTGVVIGARPGSAVIQAVAHRYHVVANVPVSVR